MITIIGAIIFDILSLTLASATPANLQGGTLVALVLARGRAAGNDSAISTIVRR